MGEVRRWSSFSGMEIVLSNYQFHKTIAFNLHRMQQWWNLIFVYKDPEVQVGYSTNKLMAGNSYLYFMNDFEVLFEYEKKLHYIH